MVIATAAHCLYSRPDPEGSHSGGYHTDVQFSPGFNQGFPLLGNWEVVEPKVSDEWMHGLHIGEKLQDFDIGFAVVRPKVDGGGEVYTVEDVAGGGHDMYFEHTDFEPEEDYSWRRDGEIVGYPTGTGSWKRDDNLHNGLLPFKCTAPWTNVLFISHGTTPCDMGKGASGGPWLTDVDENGFGYLMGITSYYRAFDGARLNEAIYSPHLQNESIALIEYARADNASEEWKVGD